MKNILLLLIVSLLFIGCKKNDHVQLRIENQRDYEITNIQVGELNYGSLAPTQISDYKMLETGKTTGSYDMNNQHYSGEIETWGSGKLRMRINKDASLNFINE
ncbi:MAG: hypothetical protein ACHQNT_05825 [Bacteroidia bacterium]